MTTEAFAHFSRRSSLLKGDLVVHNRFEQENSFIRLSRMSSPRVVETLPTSTMSIISSQMRSSRYRGQSTREI
jgi:hypothetical protein